MLLYSVNLCLVLATGIWISLWFFHNSEWFPVIGGALGLGGFLAWAAFVTNVVSDARKASYQTLLDTHVMEKRATIWTLIAINVVALLMWPSTHGGLELINTSSAQSLSVQIDDEEPIFVAPQASYKTFLASGLFAERQHGLRVGGSPDIAVTVQAFARRTSLLPEAAWRQALVLVRPAQQAADADVFVNNSYTLKISVCSDACETPDRWSTVFEAAPYRGFAVLVGTDRHTVLPDSVLQQWRAEGLPSELAEMWSHPTPAKATLAGDGTQTKLRVQVLSGSGADARLSCSIAFEIDRGLQEVRIMGRCDHTKSYLPRAYQF